MMAPHRDGRRGGGSNRSKRDADLSCLLTEEEKAELLKLVRSIVGRMHHRIARVFNSVPEIKPSTVHFHTQHDGFWQIIPIAQLKAAAGNLPPAPAGKNKENEPGGLPTNTNLQNAQTSVEVKVEEALHREEAETLTPGRLGELKKEVISYFRKWNQNITKRFSEISASKNGITNPKIVPKSSVASIRAKAVEDAGFASPTNAYDLETMEHFPPISTTLVSLPEEKRALILHSMCLLVLSLDHYTSYTRVLLLYLTSSLNLPLGVLVAEEKRIARALSNNVPDLSPEELAQKRADEQKAITPRSRGRFSSSAMKGIAHTLAAPLIAAGLGSVLGMAIGHVAAASLLGPLSQSQVSASSLFGLVGSRPGAKSILACTKDVQDFSLIPLHGANKEGYRDGRAVNALDRRMRLVFCIDGWLDDKCDAEKTWNCIGDKSEAFMMKWEVESLMKLAAALQTVVRSEAWKIAKQEIVDKTCMSDPMKFAVSDRASPVYAHVACSHAKAQELIVAFDSPKCAACTNPNVPNANPFEVAAVLKDNVWPRDLMRISKLIDNPWSIAMVRADKAGAALADIIINRGHGERSVSLIGYSLGARVIYTCLMILAERRIFGMIESVVMIGNPAPADSRVWCVLRTVVAGRIINVFSKTDYILGFLYRTSSTRFGIAGLEEIQGASGVENLDVSHMVRGHLRYQNLVSCILKMISWEDLDHHCVMEDEAAVAVRDEQHTNKLVTDFKIDHGLPTKIKTMDETRPEFAYVPKVERPPKPECLEGKQKAAASSQPTNPEGRNNGQYGSRAGGIGVHASGRIGGGRFRSPSASRGGQQRGFSKSRGGPSFRPTPDGNYKGQNQAPVQVPRGSGQTQGQGRGQRGPPGPRSSAPNANTPSSFGGRQQFPPNQRPPAERSGNTRNTKNDGYNNGDKFGGNRRGGGRFGGGGRKGANQQPGRNNEKRWGNSLHEHQAQNRGV